MPWVYFSPLSNTYIVYFFRRKNMVRKKLVCNHDHVQMQWHQGVPGTNRMQAVLKKILLGPIITQRSFCSLKRPKNLLVTPKRWVSHEMTAIPHEVLIPEVFCLFPVAFSHFACMLKAGVVRNHCMGIGLAWDSRIKSSSRWSWSKSRHCQKHMSIVAQPERLQFCENDHKTLA